MIKIKKTTKPPVQFLRKDGNLHESVESVLFRGGKPFAVIQVGEGDVNYFYHIGNEVRIYELREEDGEVINRRDTKGVEFDNKKGSFDRKEMNYYYISDESAIKFDLKNGKLLDVPPKVLEEILRRTT